MKEIKIITLIKLRLLKLENIESHFLIAHLKSQIEKVKSKTKNFLETARGVNDDHLASLDNITKAFDNLLLIDYIA